MSVNYTLFGAPVMTVPATEGIKYAGSKLKLLPHILRLAHQTGARSVLDGFSGTTRVSQAFAQSGYKVFCNDVSAWSRVFGICYLMNRVPRMHYEGIINHLNSVSPENGWFTEHYGGIISANGQPSAQQDGLKKPWQIHNTRKLDGIRSEIDRMGLSPIEQAVALTSLILGLDRVDSTIGHFASYLREWSKRSYKMLQLEVPKVFISREENEVLQRDIFDVSDMEVDLAYYDPPYGSNNEKMPPSRVRYTAYYHVWTSICLNDKPELFGKAKRRVDSSDKVSASIFEEFRKNPSTGRYMAVEALERLITSTRAKWIILSYSSGGRTTAAEIDSMIRDCGQVVEFVKVNYQRNVMANMRWTNEWLNGADSPNCEYLFLIHKG